MESYQKGIARLSRPGEDDPDNRSEAATGQVRLGKALTSLGRVQEAAASYRKALTMAEPLAAAKPPNTLALYAIADAYFSVGELSRMAAAKSPAASARYKQSWTEARAWYSKSADAWNKIPNPGAVTPSGFPCGSPKMAAQAIADSDAALGKVQSSSLSNASGVKR